MDLKTISDIFAMIYANCYFKTIFTYYVLLCFMWTV